MDNSKQDIIDKAKLKAILDIINQMDELKLEGLGGNKSDKPVGVTMVSVEKKKPESEDMSEPSEPTENTGLDQVEDVSEGEAPETEEEMDESSALGRLRKRLKGIA